MDLWKIADKLYSHTSPHPRTLDYV